jgi:hypothetical protein
VLSSIEQPATRPEVDISLILSIDRGERGVNPEVCGIAEKFQWEHGEKTIIPQAAPLGLVKHYLRSGDLAEQYESIILLEDDLFVSPVYYYYASQALDAYQEDERIAGISLYALWFNGYTQQPFVPLSDDGCFLLQILILRDRLSQRQWEYFKSWLPVAGWRVPSNANIHEMFSRFDRDEWFPIRTWHLVDTGRYFVFPRVSLATGFGDPGAHFERASSFFQVPLQTAKERYRFKPFDESFAVYDSYFEILPDRLSRLNSHLLGYRYAVDLYGTKSLDRLRADPSVDFLLTSRPGSNGSLSEENVANGSQYLFQVPGSRSSYVRKMMSQPAG